MITEEDIRKAAREILGEEGKDWCLKVEVGHKKWMRRVEVQCEHCRSYLHVLFDFRESLNFFKVKDRLKRLKLQKPCSESKKQ